MKRATSNNTINANMSNTGCISEVCLAMATMSASAIQATQVYSMGVFWAAIGVGLLVFALICVVGAQPMKADEQP